MTFIDNLRVNAGEFISEDLYEKLIENAEFVRGQVEMLNGSGFFQAASLGSSFTPINLTDLPQEFEDSSNPHRIIVPAGIKYMKFVGFIAFFGSFAARLIRFRILLNNSGTPHGLPLVGQAGHRAQNIKSAWVPCQGGDFFQLEGEDPVSGIHSVIGNLAFVARR
jgi:hypothetical protein